MICLAICKQTNKPAIFHLTRFRKQGIWCTEIGYEFEILYITNNIAAQSTTWLKLCYWNEKRYKTVGGPLWNNACYKQKSNEISSFALLWFRVSSNIKTGERGLWSKWKKRETPLFEILHIPTQNSYGTFLFRTKMTQSYRIWNLLFLFFFREIKCQQNDEKDGGIWYWELRWKDGRRVYGIGTGHSFGT